MDNNLIDKKQYNVLLGNAIRALRIELKLSQEKFAEKSGLCRTYIGSIERGEKNISVYNLYRVLSSVDVKIEKFMNKI